MKKTLSLALTLMTLTSILTLPFTQAVAQDDEAKRQAEAPKSQDEKDVKAEEKKNPAAARKRVNEGQAFGVVVENDSRNVGGPGIDQAYSNGVKLSYVYARDKVPSWAPRSITDSEFLRKEVQRSKVNFGVSLNHQIYTPSNTSFMTLTPNDRPYAGWANMAFSMHMKNDARSHTLEASLGLIGPNALGEQVQNSFHRLIEASPAQGWAHQLHNEPAVQISYQQRLQFFELRNRWGPYFDLIPMAGAGLGNVFIGTHAGMIARLGINLPDDFGPARPSGGETDSFVSPTDTKSSYYVFGSIRGNAVARNIFLDGNTFRQSHRVTKYPFTAETEVGVGFQIMPISIVWRLVVRSPDFEEKSDVTSFASVGLTYFTH